MRNRETSHSPTVPEGIDVDRVALGIRQPWVELILRGFKTCEVRSRPVALRGRIYLYSSRSWSTHSSAIQAMSTYGVSPEGSPTGMLVGSVDIVDCRAAESGDAARACVPEELLEGQYVWCLANAERLAVPQPVHYLPFGVWFYPYQRKRT